MDELIPRIRRHVEGGRILSLRLAKAVDTHPRSIYREAMEIALTIEQEAQLFQLAALEGKSADELAREVLLRGLRAEEATLNSALTRSIEGQEAAARMLEARKSNMLPEGVSIQDLVREGRA